MNTQCAHKSAFEYTIGYLQNVTQSHDCELTAEIKVWTVKIKNEAAVFFLHGKMKNVIKI